jgi:hypothetical protein
MCRPEAGSTGDVIFAHRHNDALSAASGSYLPPVGSVKATVKVDPTGSHDCAE